MHIIILNFNEYSKRNCHSSHNELFANTGGNDCKGYNTASSGTSGTTIGNDCKHYAGGSVCHIRRPLLCEYVGV